MLNLSGQRFSRLVALQFVRLGTHGAIWECTCDCGGHTEVRASYLRSGKTRSCGCLAKETARLNGRAVWKHGHRASTSPTPTYVSWQGMRQRCFDPNCADYEHYGARGITVCERWSDFRVFLADMGERPPGTTLDRWPNGRGDYEPGNCRWATLSEQNRNRARRTHCAAGHELTPQNAYRRRDNSIRCRICHRNAERQRVQAQEVCV